MHFNEGLIHNGFDASLRIKPSFSTHAYLLYNVTGALRYIGDIFKNRTKNA